MVQTKIFDRLQQWIVRHPALFSAIFIYSYYMLTSITFFFDYYRKEDVRGLALWDYVSQFDALPFMWLLAYTFVRLLNLRERAHAQEKKTLKQERQLEIQQTQIQTLQEVTFTLMDRINNPVAIIVMYVRRLLKKIRRHSEIRKDLEAIRQAAKRISRTLEEIAATEEYKVLELSYGRILDTAARKKGKNPSL